MPKIHVDVSFDTASVLDKIKSASDFALTDMGSQALQDITRHVPEDQGTLKSSGISHSDIKAENGVYTARWSTPYAKYLWYGDVMYGNPTSRTYGPKKLSFTDALAHEQWTIYAKELYKDEWTRVYEVSLKRRLK